jgi:solute carrier family 25 (adenine nucleotide translocator) protein 4/5/6/31
VVKFLSGILAGGMAGTTALWVTYPLQVARTRLAADIGRNASTREYTRFTDCIVSIYRHDGIVGLYRGFLFSAFGLFTYRGLYFGIYDGIKPHLTEKGSDYFLNYYVLGWISSFIASVVAYPIDSTRMRIIMQTGREDKQYSNARQCISYVWRTEGIPGFFRGVGYNCVFLSFSGALLLVLYDKFQNFFSS